jgi:hypothetical protein
MRKQYNSNKKSEYKDQPKSDVQSIPSLVSNIAKEDGSTIYMVNSQQLDVGGTAVGEEIFVKHLLINGLHTSATSVNSLLDRQLQDLIDAFATARGYSTNVTVADVAAYLKASEEVLSLITYLHRSQNATKFTTDTGYNLGTVLGSRPNGFTSAADIANFIGDNATTLTPLINDGSVGISNVDWGRVYLSLLSDVKLPRATVSYILSMFGTFYSYDKSGSFILAGVPAFMASTSSVSTLIAGLDTVLTNLRGANADLIDIMHYLGFNSELAVAIDFARDQRALTVPMVNDEVFNAMAFNGFVQDPIGGLDSDVANLFYDVAGVYSPLHTIDAADFNANAVFTHTLLRGKITAHYQIEFFASTVTNSLSYYDYPYVVVPDISTVSSFSAAQAVRARDVQSRYTFNLGPALPFVDQPTLTEIAPGDYNMNTGLITGQVLEATGTFALPAQEFAYYKLAKFADMIMSDVPWRMAIQNLVNAIRPRSITRSE